MSKHQLQRVQQYFDAWNKADPKAVAAFFCKDAVYIDTSLGKEYRGGEIERYVSDIFTARSGSFHFSIINKPVINADVVFLQSSLVVKSNDNRQQYESAELIHFRGDKIATIQTYYNLEEYLQTPLTDKYAKSGLDANEVKTIKARLEALMNESEPYRDPTLKLQDLTELLDVRRNHLSQILNHEYQMKFFDFINQYRLRAFIQSLHDHDDSTINITSLAYDAGFNSSSVFYKIFKRYQEISPRQYIDKIQQLNQSQP